MLHDGRKVGGVKIGTRFTVREIPLTGLSDLLDVLVGLASDRTSFVIRDRLKPDSGAGPHARNSQTFDDVPHNWLMLDVDEAESPVGLDPVSVAAIEWWIAHHLPTEFYGASYVHQFSSSAGTAGAGRRIKAHLWFWLAVPATSAALLPWAHTTPGLDPAILHRVQIHYTADPIFVGCPDPLAGRRLGMVAKAYGAVPAFPLPRHAPRGATGGTTAALPVVVGVEGRIVDGREWWLLRWLLDAVHTRLRQGLALDADALAQEAWQAFNDACDPAAGSKVWTADKVADKAHATVRRAQEGAIAGLPRIGLDPHWQLDPQPIERIRAELGAAITAFFAQPESVRVLAAPPGAGKTEAVIRAVLAMGRTVDIFVPTVKLAEEVAGKLGATATVIRGRGQDDPGQPGSKMCHRSGDAEAVSGAGLSVQRHLCRVCPSRAVCGYQAQFANAGSVRVMAHAYLSLPPRGDMSKADVVVIDEAFHDQVLEIGTFSLGGVSQISPWSLGGAIRSGLERGDLLNTLHVKGFVPDDLRKAARSLWAQHKPKLDGTLTGTALRKALPRGGSVRGLATVLLWLARELEAMKVAALGIIWTRDPWFARIPPARGMSHVAWLDGGDVRFSIPKRLQRLDGVPVLVIDAQANPSILQPIFIDRDVSFTRWDGVRNANIVQVATHNYSGAHFAKDADRIGQIADLARLMPGTTALFLTKPARCQLTGEVEGGGTLPVPEALPDGVLVGNFGQLRGINDFADADAALVVGRSQMPATAAEAYRGLFWADPAPLMLPGDYTHADRGYCHQSRRGASVWVHPDGRIQAIVEQRREWELVQAIDRLRLFAPGTSRTVFLFGDLPLPVEVTAFAEASDMVPHEAIRIALDAGGVFIATPAWLCSAAPGRFSKLQGARDWLRRSGWQNVASPLQGNPSYLESECHTLPSPTALRFRAAPKRADRARQLVDAFTLGRPLEAPIKLAQASGGPIEAEFLLGGMLAKGKAHPDGRMSFDLFVGRESVVFVTPDAAEAAERLAILQGTKR